MLYKWIVEEETSTELNLLDNSLETSEPVVEPEPVYETDQEVDTKK